MNTLLRNHTFQDGMGLLAAIPLATARETIAAVTGLVIAVAVLFRAATEFIKVIKSDAKTRERAADRPIE
jgi:hypothetical protein